MRLFPNVFVVASLLLSAACNPEKTANGAGISPASISDLNRPATVLVQSTHTAQVRYLSPRLAALPLAQLRNEIEQLVRQGRIENSPAGRFTVFWNTIVDKPATFFLPGAVQTGQLHTTASGTGFIVTPSGYVITNEHVVESNVQALRKDFIGTAIVESARSPFNQVVQQAVNTYGVKPNDEMLKQLLASMVHYAESTTTIMGTPQRQVVVLMAQPAGIVLGKPLGAATERALEARVVAEGQSSPGIDIALLKIADGAGGGLRLSASPGQMPTVILGDDTLIRDGDPIHVLGYPGVATWHPYADKSGEMNASFTSGNFSRRVPLKSGWTALQASTAITHGNSGGPAFDGRGEVIGIATFGSIDEQEQQAIAGFNFFVPVTLVKQFLARAKVIPSVSTFTRTYRDGLLLFDQRRYSDASKQFSLALKERNDYWVREKVAEASRRIAHGEERRAWWQVF